MALSIQAAAGHQGVDVDVQVQVQVLRPGVQDQGERAGGAQPLGVGGELGEGGCGALHDGAVDPARVGLCQGVEGMGEGEDEVAVGHGQQIGELGLAPGVARAALALRAVAVAAGTEHPLLAGTLIALLARAAQRGGAASDDVAPDTGLRRAQLGAVHGAAQEGRAEGAQHLGQGGAQGGCRLSGWAGAMPVESGVPVVVATWANATATPGRQRRRRGQAWPCASSGWWCSGGRGRATG